MDQAESTTWAQAPEHHPQPAQPAPNDDLSDFFDFENMDLMNNFPPFEDNQQQQQQHHQQQQQPAQPLSEAFDGDGANRNPDQTPHGWPIASKFQQQQQLHEQQHSQHPQYQMAQGIPATPNSAELFPSHYLAERRGQLQDGRFVGRLDDLAMYTPDMTPNVTGSDSVYSTVPEYAMPGSYMNQLSPLTSPAMRPQGHGGPYHHSTAGSSLAASPVDLSFDAAAEASSGPERPRKTRKKAAGSTTSTPSTTRSRTASKATAAKRKLSPAARGAADKTPKALPMDGLDGTRSAQPSPLITMLASQRDGRDASSKSISPRPLTEARMAPPPKPHPASSGPAAARGPLERLQQSGLGPATPASLMRLQTQRASANLSPSGSSQPSPLTGGIETGMGFLALPESAAPLDLSQAGSKAIIRPPPSPAGARPGSALASPTGTLAKGQSKPSSSRKRASQSNMVSPALRPKISPSIKPLLPEGGHPRYSQDEHTLLLASKSNYQNLLEGNTVPGVHYPSELATNLTSKRTSHKIAEQGRRNRINTALQEMQSLLPPALSRAAAKDMPYESASNSPNGEAENGENGEHATAAKSAAAAAVKSEAKGSSSAQGGNSKAATVELAIQYIKSLNNKLADQASENERLRQEMARLKQAAGMSADDDQDKASLPAPSPVQPKTVQTKTESSSDGNVSGGEESSRGSSTGASVDSAMVDA